MLSSTFDRPSSTAPSRGTLSPGRTRRRSPTWTAASGTSSSDPSSRTRRAIAGARLSSARIAPPVCSRARNSSIWPSSTSTTMTAAASKYTATEPSAARKASGKIPGATVATTLNSQAAPVPSAIRVNMLRLRFTRLCQPRTKNGQPAHSTTGVPSASWIQLPTCGPPTRCIIPVRWPPISRATTGTVSTSPIQKRRVKSNNSGLGATSAVATSGSRAMPQIGQLPGPTCRICGCMGQV